MSDNSISKSLLKKSEKIFEKSVDKWALVMYNNIRRRKSGVRKNLRGVAQSGSARALGAWGRGFESLHPDHFPTSGEGHPDETWPRGQAA